MANVPRAMDWRLLRRSLWEQRGIAGLAVLAVAIGASVASALLHVSGDVERKLQRELRSLGPNVLVIPAAGVEEEMRNGPAALDRFLDEGSTSPRLRSAGIDAVPMLYVQAHASRPTTTSAPATIPVIGTTLAAARALHPSWKLEPERTGAWIGTRLAKRLGVAAGSRLRLTPVAGDVAREVPIAATLETGGPDDEALWIPLADAQALGGQPGAVSLYQARVHDAGRARTLARSLGSGDLEVVPLGALTATEARLLERLRRLMALVTAVALVAAGLCAFGTLTDLALERRRDIALMKALGATQQDVLRQLGAEAVTIGLIGGTAGWLLGLGMAQVIGREVFHSAIALRADVPVIVLLLSLAVATLASFGPARLALGIEPATALKGD